MRVLTLKIKHDCTIGTRCERFKVVSYSMSLGNWTERGYNYTSERHTIEGEPRNVKMFIGDLRKDKRLIHIEVDQNTVFFIARIKSEKIPTYFYTQRMFFVKPVYVNKEGYEFWEVASYDKAVLDKFLEGMQGQGYEHLEILSYKDVKLNNIYFPAIAPNLSEKQKKAFSLAVDEGYYDIPKRTELKKLASIMGLSLATYQEHLKRAEVKIIPKLKFG